MQHTITIQEIEISVDKENVSVMGIGSAGWSDYQKQLRKDGITVYTTTTGIIEDGRSIYEISHGETTWEKRAEEKAKDPKSVESALNEYKKILFTLDHPDTMKSMYHIIKQALRIEITHPDWQKNHIKIERLLSKIEKPINQEEKQKAISLLIKVLISICSPDPIKESNGQPVDLSGYNFVHIFTNDSIFNDCFKNEDKNKYNDLKSWIEYININTPGSVIQRTLDRSKRMIMDTLQHNLQMLREGNPLVPIHFVIASEEIKNISKLFQPNWNTTIKKLGFNITDAEIRMTYKLTKELDDPLINEIMKKTVFFYKRTEKNGFIQIPSPWKGEEKQTWKQRTRTGNKLAYKDREHGPDDKLQPWLQELKKLSQKTSEILTERAKFSARRLQLI